MIFNQAVLAAAALPQAICSSGSHVYAENQGQRLNLKASRFSEYPPGVGLERTEYSFSPARCSGSHDLAEHTVFL